MDEVEALPPGYPTEWEADVVLRDGSVGHVRAILPSDQEALQRFHSRQSDESIYLRFFAPLRELSSRDLHRFTNVDYRDRVALVVTHRGEVIGIGRYDRIDAHSAEVAFNISDDFQGRGIGSVLLLLAQWFQLVENLSPLMTGVALLPLAAANLVSSVVAAGLAKRLGVRVVVAGGLLLAGVGVAGFGLIPTPGILAAEMMMVLLGLSGGSLAMSSAMIMSGSPAERAGNAASMEETSYEVGTVLGIAVLGTIAALLYRDRLSANASGLTGIDPGALAESAESIGSATAIAERTGSPGLRDAAVDAFNTSFLDTSLIGGLVLIAVAVAVYLLVPRRFDLTTQAH